MDARIQIPVECQERARQAGHRDAQVQNGDIRQRLFLARARGVQAPESKHAPHLETNARKITTTIGQ